ncbi:MAG: precorrin-3B C(17)-methyltransferase [Sporomusaceae bacterium]|jgi:precorrin-3B C17-methyltransferase|nr:precorrin-3B C(17)-methyltransferase [Sporomusaceae bacterium]
MKLYAVGLGPGEEAYLAPRAKAALLASDVIVGYTGYIELIPDLLKGKKVLATGMTSEAERCEMAVNETLKGQTVSVVSSGDAGIYGMASLLYELAANQAGIEIEVVPGITAAISAAAILGSPLTNDFAVISLSDLLTPWDVIEKRLHAAAAADFVICLYNPQSKKRSDHLAKACAIALQYKQPETNCGYVKNAFRNLPGETRILTLAELQAAQVDMFTTVIIGNASTKVIKNKLVTTRGYRL